MSKIADPIQRARKASTKVQAARLYQELDAELALSDHGPDWDAQAEQAQQMLEAKAEEHDWGDLNDHEATTAFTHARGGGGHRIAHAWAGPRLSRSAQRFLDDDDAHERLANGEHPAGTPEPQPTARKRAARQRVGGSLLTGGRRALGYASSVPGYTSTRRIAVNVMWATLGLSLLYLLLSDAENPARGWPSAVQTAVGSLTTGVMAVVRPVDPLRPHMPAPATRNVTVARTPTSGPTPLPRRPTIPRRPAHR